MAQDSFRIEIPISALKNLTRNQSLAFLLWWFGLTERKASDIMNMDRSTYHETLKGRIYKGRKYRSKGAFEKLGIDYKKVISPAKRKRKPGTKWLHIKL